MSEGFVSVLESWRDSELPQRKMEAARSDRKRQLRARGWQGGGFGLEGKNQRPGAKTSVEITAARTSGRGEKKRREVGEVEVGRCSAVLGTSWLLGGENCGLGLGEFGLKSGFP